MTATTSPPPTESPSLGADLGDRARLLGGHVVLHLHCFEDDDCVAGFDGITDGDIDLHDGALHRTVTSPLPGRLRARPTAAAATRRHRPRPLRQAPGGFRNPHGDAEALAVDFDVELTLDLGLVVVSARRWSRTPRRDQGLLRPIWSSARYCGNRRARGWRCRPGSWWQRLRPAARRVLGEAVDGDLPRAAPDDELADEIVVELTDLVAGFVAGVPAGAETIGWGERRDQAGDGRARHRQDPLR